MAWGAMWGEDEIKILTKMAAAHASARLIGIALGRTKNSVIGRCHRNRIKLTGKNSVDNFWKKHPVTKSEPVKQSANEHSRRCDSSHKKVGALPHEPPIAKTAVIFHHPNPTCGVGEAHAALKANDCKWPFGDPLRDDFHFCCLPRTIGSPYCAEHTKRGAVRRF